MTEIKYPQMRRDLQGNLFALSNIDYQRRVWIMKLPYNNIQHDEFSYVVHFLFDDSHLETDAASAIGEILKNAAEAEAVKRVIDSIECIFQKYGTKLTDAEYIELPEWSAVISAAAQAVAIVKD